MNPAQRMVLVFAALAASLALAVAPAPAMAIEPTSATGSHPAAATFAQQPPRVYLFRGFAGMIFARGLDALAERIEHLGFSATTNEAVMCPVVAKEAIAGYRTNPAPVVVIGNSIGGACAVGFAEMLESEKIPVGLLVTIDPNRIAHDVPANVERYINLFQSNSVLGGGDVKPAKGFAGHYASFDVAEHVEFNHLNLEKAESIHDQLVTKIQQLAATPARAGGEAVPLRYTVPADAAIELWDSGTPISARGGDTLQSLAAFYGVPLWSLTQINKLPDAAPLADGQRVVVPRRLMPMLAPAGGAASGQTPLKR
jgi:hypothetical protein